MIKFPSIRQFRDVINSVKNSARFAGLDDLGKPMYSKVSLPTLTFVGTVKLHGTNAALSQDTFYSNIKYQSRERELELGDDNAGFVAHMSKFDLCKYMIELREFFSVSDSDCITVFGEWCGGNIQKGVAINSLPKMFVVFAVRIGEHTWVRPCGKYFHKFKNKNASIYTISELSQPVYIDIDFNMPELAQNKLVECTLAVEAECPVGKYFGESGIGEGLVWHCTSNPTSELVFKTKGEKHSASKVKTIAAVDVERYNNLNELAASIMTENRMNQMLETHTGIAEFLRACVADCFKEEHDTIVASGFTDKEFSKASMNVARKFFINRL